MSEPKSPYRLKTAERVQRAVQRFGGSEEAKPKKLRLAAAQGTAIAGFAVKRSMDGLRQMLGRVLTPKPKPIDVDPSQTFLVIGHRGSAATTVENTLPSMQRALDDGANAIEIDLSFTKDGEVVLWHDWNPNDTIALARQVGLEPNVKFLPDAPALWSAYRRMTHDLTLAELREHYGYKKSFLFFWKKPVESHIPTFREFLEWAKEQPRLRSVLLDMKIPGDEPGYVKPMVSAMLAQIEDVGAKCDFVFLTPHEAILAEMKEIAPESHYSFDVEVPPGIVFEPVTYSATITAERLSNRYASVGRPALTLSAWKIYQAIISHDVKHRDEMNANDGGTLALLSWTINNPAEAKRLMNLGVNGILTDKPGKLKTIAEKLGKRLD